MLRFTHLFYLLMVACRLMAQVAYPGQCIQDENWSSGQYQLTAVQPITSPCDPTEEVLISASADVQMVSATQVRLAPGFHAGGFANNGRFHAYIDEALGAPADLVLISPDPATAISNSVVHVPKWEKFEIGLKLPQEYQDAISSFFENYYSNGTDQPATPGALDRPHDLNPYSDDSLLLVMTLTSPSNVEQIKWGFYMTEAEWTAGTTGRLAEDLDDDLYTYHIRYRFAPDEEGTWSFALSVQAPHTSTPLSVPLPALLHEDYSFVCDPPLADNNGFLTVNPVNKRVLQFNNGEPFFGMGTNMSDTRHGSFGGNPDSWYTFYRRDFDNMKRSMIQLHSAGGNFMRMFLMRHLFAPEYVNLGVYDAYHYAQVPCPSAIAYNGNSQTECWAFDQMLDHARENNIYIQPCIDPYPPIGAYETHQWGAHPYVINYVEPTRDPNTGVFDTKRFFYSLDDNGDRLLDEGVFYYWKRKYKYIMARWGYSVNIAAFELFNEVDQMLRYQENDLEDPEPGSGLCTASEVLWPLDPDVRTTLNDWITDILGFTKGSVVPQDPAHSPLGESERLFTLSFTDVLAAPDADYHLAFANQYLDFIDVHRGLYEGEEENSVNFGFSGGFRNHFDKPFRIGEYQTTGTRTYDGDNYATSQYFMNYDVSFHNEIWSSSFFGNCTTGTSWFWDRIFWWPDAMPEPPDDPDNQFLVPSNVWDDEHIINLGPAGGTPNYAGPIPNRTVYHHFKPLSDMLSNPDLQGYHFFDGEFDAHEIIDPVNGIECYYLKDGFNTTAIGWVHNLNAYWEKSYYLATGVQDFLGCTASTPINLVLDDFLTYHDFYVTWFPTRMNTTVCPDDQEVNTGASGSIELDLSTEPFGSVTSTFLDTLHTDYGFVITTGPVEKSLLRPQGAVASFGQGLNFMIYPNPALDEEVFLHLPDTALVNIELLDLAGRRILEWRNMTGPVVRLTLGSLAMGLYGMRISNEAQHNTKKLIIQ